MPFPHPFSVDDDLRRWRRQFPDTTAIEDLRPRRQETIVGIVTRIRLTPGASLTLHLADGTGEVEAIWPGRRELPGVMLGSALRLSATVGSKSQSRHKLLNPAWSPVSEPFAFPP